MVATAAILDLVSIDFLTQRVGGLVWFFGGSLGSSIFTMFYFSLSLIFHAPTDNFPLRGICHALHCPCFIICDWLKPNQAQVTFQQSEKR
jgi:hypothetical protein